MKKKNEKMLCSVNKLNSKHVFVFGGVLYQINNAMDNHNIDLFWTSRRFMQYASVHSYLTQCGPRPVLLVRVLVYILGNTVGIDQ